MNLYDLSNVNLNCNVPILNPKRVVHGHDERIYVLNRKQTSNFCLPTADGLIRFKHYNMEYMTYLRYGCLNVYIKMKPFPVYDTIWIQFCKAIDYLIRHQNLQYTSPSKIVTKVYDVPTKLKSKHYIIRRKGKKRIQSRNTNYPFRNYPRQLVTRIGHERHYASGKVIFIKEQVVSVVKLNQAQGTRVG